MRFDHLIRRVGGIEFPAPGRWTIPRTHLTVHYGARTGPIRRAHGRAAAATGVLQVADDPTLTTLVVHIDAAGGDAARTVPTLSELIDRGRRSAVTLRTTSMMLLTGHVWTMEGRADVSGIEIPARITVDYHGVHRAGDDGKAWLTMRAEISHDVSGVRRPRPVEIVADILAVAPRRAASGELVMARHVA